MSDISLTKKYLDSFFDDETGVPIGIALPHAKVHEGSMYECSRIFGTVPASGYARYIVKPSTKEMHITISAAAEAKAYVYMWMNTKATTLGTTETVYNMKDSSSNTSTASVYFGGTVNTTGGKFGEGMMPGGGSRKDHIGGAIREGTEKIFGISTTYTVEVQNAITTSKDIAVIMEWYEKTP